MVSGKRPAASVYLPLGILNRKGRNRRGRGYLSFPPIVIRFWWSQTHGNDLSLPKRRQDKDLGTFVSATPRTPPWGRDETPRLTPPSPISHLPKALGLRRPPSPIGYTQLKKGTACTLITPLMSPPVAAIPT